MSGRGSLGPVVARFVSAVALAAGRAARLETPGRSFHIDGSSSKWISAEELACRPQASSAPAVSRMSRHDDRRTRGGAVFDTLRRRRHRRLYREPSRQDWMSASSHAGPRLA
jgi:hypothetical protein